MNARPIRRSPLKPRHRICVAADVSGFSGHDEASQTSIRNAVHAMVGAASELTGVRLKDKDTCDRGDGIVAVTCGAGMEVVLTDFICQLGENVRRHNAFAPPELRIPLRVALDDGYVVKDARGRHSGDPLIRVARMVDAPDFKTRMAELDTDYAVIISNGVYEVARGCHLLDDRDVEKVHVSVKETELDAWLLVPQRTTEA